VQAAYIVGWLCIESIWLPLALSFTIQVGPVSRPDFSSLVFQNISIEQSHRCAETCGTPFFRLVSSAGSLYCGAGFVLSPSSYLWHCPPPFRSNAVSRAGFSSLVFQTVFQAEQSLKCGKPTLVADGNALSQFFKMHVMSCTINPLATQNVACKITIYVSHQGCE